MTDRTGHDAIAFWLAYLHPAWMVLSLGLAGLALRSGLRMRSARLRGARRPRGAYRRHLRLARPAVPMLLAGFAAGPASAFWLRGLGPFGTAHGWVGLVAITLLVATGVQGWRLQHGRTRAVDVHALLAMLSVLASAAAVGTGFVLLP